MSKLTCPDCHSNLEAEAGDTFYCIECDSVWDADEIMPVREKPARTKPWTNPNDIPPHVQPSLFGSDDDV